MLEMTMATTGTRPACRRVRWCVGALVLGVLAAACSGSPTGTEVRSSTRRAPIERSTIAATVAANSQLATDLYKQLARDHQNFSFSPYAVSVALGQVGTGASGVTATQLAAVQHQPAELKLESGLNSLALQIASRAGDRQSDVRQGHISIQLPISLWGQQDTQIRRPFLMQLSRWFGTGMRMVDYRSDPGAARIAINNWVADQSSNLFTEIVSPGQITDGTRLVMTAAAVIAAPWDQRFDATRTRPTTFHLLNGQTRDATTMSVSSPNGLLYAKGDQWQAVMVPYLGRQLAMVVLVPDAGRFGAVESGLDGAELQAVLAALRPTPLALEMPRFQISTRVNLNAAVSALGASSLFNPSQASLPGITADEALAVSQFDEQAFISADEEGTQASAPTAVRNGPLPTPPTTSLLIDRPFLVAVVDRASGEPLLFGRVVDPMP
jgi:serpin B